MKVREVIKLIEQDGWYLARTRGSHRQFKHPTKSGLVTIAGKPSDDAGTWHVKQHNDASSTKGTEANRRMRGNRANCRAVEGSDRSPYPLSDRYQNPYHLEQLDDQHPKVKCSQQPLPPIHTMN